MTILILTLELIFIHVALDKINAVRVYFLKYNGYQLPIALYTSIYVGIHKNDTNSRKRK